MMVVILTLASIRYTDHHSQGGGGRDERQPEQHDPQRRRALQHRRRQRHVVLGRHLRQRSAPGSIYHHFPEGKEQLAEDAIRYTAERVLAHLRASTAVTPGDVLANFVAMWRHVVVSSGASTGCAIAGVAVDTPRDDAEVMRAVNVAFRSWSDLRWPNSSLRPGYRLTAPRRSRSPRSPAWKARSFFAAPKAALRRSMPWPKNS